MRNLKEQDNKLMNNTVTTNYYKHNYVNKTIV